MHIDNYGYSTNKDGYILVSMCN